MQITIRRLHHLMVCNSIGKCNKAYTFTVFLGINIFMVFLDNEDHITK
jgi:hypothetical protein